MYIVAEYLFLENFIINYTMFQIVKTITKTKVARRRVFFTGLLAALYPFVFFFESTIFLTNFYMKMIISVVLIKLAYNSKNLRLYLKQLSAFYLISFIFAGASLGFYYFSSSYMDILFKPDNFREGFPIKYLMLGVGFGAILIINILSYYSEKISKEDFILDIRIHLKDKRVNLVALIDTGNSLIEPLTKSPVFVVEYNAIKSILPGQLNKVFEEGQENDFLLIEDVMESLQNEMIIRLIPFKSVGVSSGILIGFKPDFIIIRKDGMETKHDDLVIAVFNGNLSTDDHYNGLLNEEILNRGDLYVSQI